MAIARALAVEPTVLPMGEPFSALDAQTRALMQLELLALRERTRTTLVYVTHQPQVLQSLGAAREQAIRKVPLPSALPMVLVGYRLGAGIALPLVASAEMIDATAGIGFLTPPSGDLMLIGKLAVGLAVLASHAGGDRAPARSGRPSSRPGMLECQERSAIAERREAACGRSWCSTGRT